MHCVVVWNPLNHISQLMVQPFSWALVHPEPIEPSGILHWPSLWLWTVVDLNEQVVLAEASQSLKAHSTLSLVFTLIKLGMQVLHVHQLLKVTRQMKFNFQKKKKRKKKLRLRLLHTGHQRVPNTLERALSAATWAKELLYVLGSSGLTSGCCQPLELMG